jgi:adenosyl cobinamide kinase/adenosyl cobinamide phosphate guanylyltransferase
LQNKLDSLKKGSPITTTSCDFDGKLILISNEAGQSVVKCGHLKRLVRRLVDPTSYGK